MKLLGRITLSLLAIGSLLFYASCGGNEPTPPSDEEVQLGKLAATWNINKVTLDNVDRTAEYNGFTLMLEGIVGAASFGYATSTAGRPAKSPWPKEGTWKFGTDVLTQVVRIDDNVQMSYVVSDTQLELTFDFSGAGYNARTSNVKGRWVFTFTK